MSVIELILTNIIVKINSNDLLPLTLLHFVCISFLHDFVIF